MELTLFALLFSFSEDLECSFAQYEATCDNAQLANKFRAFAIKVEKMSDCGSRKGKCAHWRLVMA
jgi:hypothetical protein